MPQALPAISLLLALFGFVSANVAGLLVHALHCFQTEQWGLLIGGIIVFPLGVFHGFAVMFGLL